MKKICILLSLVLVISMLFSACGSFNNFKNEKAALVGGTFAGGNGLFVRTYSFEADGTYYGTHTIYVGDFTSTNESSGTYEIKKDVIKLTNENGEYTELSYSYNSDTGKITLHLNDEVTATK